MVNGVLGYDIVVGLVVSDIDVGGVSDISGSGGGGGE